MLLTERVVDHNLHGDLRRGVDGIVGVGDEARVHAAGERLARIVKSRLGSGVVGGEEGEDDHVPDVGMDALGMVDKTSGTANVNLDEAVIVSICLGPLAASCV